MRCDRQNLKGRTHINFRLSNSTLYPLEMNSSLLEHPVNQAVVDDSVHNKSSL